MALQNLTGYIFFNGIHIFIITVNLLVLTGLWFYPFQIGFYVLLPYISYSRIVYPVELKGTGARWEYFSKNFFILNIMRKHLSLQFLPLSDKLTKAEKSPGAQFLIATFPHGVASDYRIAMDAELRNVFPNIHGKISVLAASVLFAIPVVREMAIWTGCINAKRSVAEKAIKKGRSILVLPGGEAEQIRTIYQKERVFLKSRKGFIKLAMRNQLPVIPSYVFGASDYYYTSNAFFSPRLWLQKSLGVCIPLASGMLGSVFCPLPVKTTIVYGEPLLFRMKAKGSPSNDELDNAHEEFCRALEDLFNAHKKPLGYGDRQLEIL